MDPIAFYFPARPVGGVSVLFLRLAERISITRPVIIMDFVDGFMAQNIPAGCTFVPFDKPELLPNNCVVVTQSVPVWRIPFLEMFPESTSIYYWNFHPYNLTPHLISRNPRIKYLRPVVSYINYFSFFRKNKIKELVRTLMEHDALSFTDKENLAITEKLLGVKLVNAKFLPIITGEPDKKYSLEKPRKDHVIRCVWLGRLEDFKIPILLHTIERLDAIDTLKLRFDIYGDGAQKSRVKASADACNRLDVRLMGEITPDEIDRTLIKYHIAFSMGTGALESAKLGMPTVRLDFSYKHISGLYRYRLLADNSELNVAEEINQHHLEYPSSCESLIREVVDNFEVHSGSTYRYWVSNYSPDRGVTDLLAEIDSSSMKISAIAKRKFSHPDIFTALVSFGLRKLDGNDGFIRM